MLLGTTQPVIWSDLQEDFNLDASGAVQTVLNVDAVRTSIDNILGTMIGERVMLRSFGSRLRSMVFEGITTTLMDFVATQIKQEIELWDDRVTVTAMDYLADPDRAYVSLTVKFVINGLPDVYAHQVRVGGNSSFG